MCDEPLNLRPHEPGGDPSQPADVPEAVNGEDKLAKRILSGLGFCGHYMHFHGGGVSGKAPIVCLLAKQENGEMSQQELGMHFDLKPGSLSEILSKLKSGMRLQGTVSSIVDFGAFVDLGGVDGMIHISELSWSRIKNPAEVVSVGDTLDVYVISFDPEKRKISLGVKDRTQNPWDVFMNTYKVGDVANVRIVKLMTFGAFAEVVPGVDGLIHISQIADRRIDKPSDVLSEGQMVDAKITAIDEEKKKISLSIRALLSGEEEAPVEE